MKDIREYLLKHLNRENDLLSANIHKYRTLSQFTVLSFNSNEE